MPDGGRRSISVVIAAYQAADLIAPAIRSALDQVPPPDEVVVADDGSTDDLAGALAPFGDAVRLVRIEHGGEAAAKNAGVAAASGELVAFLDADDRFLPGRLSGIGALLDADPELDVVTTDALLVSDDEVVGRCYDHGFTFAFEDQRRAILERNFVLGLCAVRRSRFLAVGGFDASVRYTTDWDLWVRMILTGSRVGFVPEPLAEYRLHGASMSARRVEMSRGRILTLERAAARTDLTDAERAVVAGSIRHERARLARDVLRTSLRDGGAGEARRAAWRLLLSPNQSTSTRCKAAVAMLAPGPVARRLRPAEQQVFVTVGDRQLPTR